MRTAFIADIHSNLHALKAVLRDIGTSGMEQLVCLGDVVGYGAHPAECVELLHKVRCKAVMGNHDYYACSETSGVDIILEEPDSATNPVWAGIRHSRQQLGADHLAWLRELQAVASVEGGLVAHAALHDFHDWPYLHTLEEARPTLNLLNGRIGFFGHTHREAIFSEDGGPPLEQLGERTWRLPADTSIAITAGGTGQPRDGDPQARWLEWDPESRTLKFHRVPYDNEAAAAAILAADLPERSAQRLLG